MSEEDGPDGAELGPIATRVLYEDEQVRIWDQSLAPGDATAAHHHELDYVLVDVAGEVVAVEPVPGHANPHFGEPFELPVSAGRSYLVPRGSVEVARNVGSSTYRAILVELKEGAG